MATGYFCWAICGTELLSEEILEQTTAYWWAACELSEVAKHKGWPLVMRRDEQKILSHFQYQTTNKYMYIT